MLRRLRLSAPAPMRTNKKNRKGDIHLFPEKVDVTFFFPTFYLRRRGKRITRPERRQKPSSPSSASVSAMNASPLAAERPSAHENENAPANHRFRNGDDVVGTYHPFAGERRPLPSVIPIDDEIIIRIDPPVIIEIAVGISRCIRGVTAVDSKIIVAVDRAVQIRIAGVGIHHQNVRAANALPAEG